MMRDASTSLDSTCFSQAASVRSSKSSVAGANCATRAAIDVALMLCEVPSDQYRVFSGVAPLAPTFTPHTALVRADADLSATAMGIVLGAFTNAGQMCIHLERLYVQRSIYSELVAKLIEQVAALKAGAEL